MSARTDFDYLRDMLTYAEDGHALTENRTEEELDLDNGLRYGLQFCLLVVGEAATHVSQQTRDKLPSVPWQEIVGMRNWIAHGYFKIRRGTIWVTATQNLPTLIDEILKFLPPEQS